VKRAEKKRYVITLYWDHIIMIFIIVPIDVNIIIVSAINVIAMNSSMPDEYCSLQRMDEVVVTKERKRVREAMRYSTVNVFINCVSVAMPDCGIHMLMIKMVTMIAVNLARGKGRRQLLPHPRVHLPARLLMTRSRACWISSSWNPSTPPPPSGGPWRTTSSWPLRCVGT